MRVEVSVCEPARVQVLERAAHADGDLADLTRLGQRRYASLLVRLRQPREAPTLERALRPLRVPRQRGLARRRLA